MKQCLWHLQVEYSPSGGAVVYVGDAAGSVYNAGRVVVTVPLGVLKDEIITFEPALPKPKLDAIDSFNQVRLRSCWKLPHQA